MLTTLDAPQASARIYPVHATAIPGGILRAGRYALRFARSMADLHAVQRLRFEVFNLELGEGLDSAYALGRDEDELDAACHHLMVIERATERVVGTYRLMLRPMALARGGFYSETEYDFAGLPDPIQDEGVELGRACVHRDHRNGRVVHLLWRGLARYLSFNERRYLFGCCSLPSLDERLALGARAYLEKRGSLHSHIRLAALPSLRCTVSEPVAEVGEIPPLFASYLSLGAKVCSEPAVDRAFKVIDFFVVLDIEELDARVHKSLLGQAWDEVPS